MKEREIRSLTSETAAFGLASTCVFLVSFRVLLHYPLRGLLRRGLFSCHDHRDRDWLKSHESSRVPLSLLMKGNPKVSDG
jgi:hypothetical protein